MKKPFYRRWWFWVPVVVVTLLVAISFLLDPIATHFARKGLAEAKDFESEIEGVHVSLLRLQVQVKQLKMTQKPVTKGKKPLIYVENVGASVLWRELIKFRIAANAQIRKMKISAYMSPQNIEKAKEAGKKIAEAAPPWDKVPEVLQSLFPFKLARLEIRDSEILLIDKLKDSNSEIWLHGLEMSFENFANRVELEGGRPASLSMRAKLMHSGDLVVFATFDPMQKPPVFAGQAELKHFDLHEVEPYFIAFTELRMPKGQFECFAAFKSENNNIVGGVKPLLKDVEIKAGDKGIGNNLMAALADSAIKLASDRVPGREAVATEIPIRGKITAPDVQIIPAILGVVRNAFVIGLSASFDNVPNKPADEKQDVLTQAAHALSKDKVSPKAQPTNGGK